MHKILFLVALVIPVNACVVIVPNPFQERPESIQKRDSIKTKEASIKNKKPIRFQVKHENEATERLIRKQMRNRG